MRIDREPKAKIPKPLDVKLACDGDLNEIWSNSGDARGDSPRERITIQEALVAPSRPIEPEDLSLLSNN